MLTCSGCRVARFCSSDHQKMASKKAALGGSLTTGRHKDICASAPQATISGSGAHPGRGPGWATEHKKIDTLLFFCLCMFVVIRVVPDPLDPPLWKVPNKALSLSHSRPNKLFFMKLSLTFSHFLIANKLSVSLSLFSLSLSFSLSVLQQTPVIYERTQGLRV